MTKLTNKLGRLHRSRIRALNSADDRPVGVFVAEDVVPETSFSLRIDAPQTSRDSGFIKEAGKPDVHVCDVHAWHRAGFEGTPPKRNSQYKSAIGRITLSDAFRTVPASWSSQTSLLADFSPQDVVYFDIETTGLKADSFSFCLGLGYWQNGAFAVDQWALVDAGMEAETLTALAQAVGGKKCVVTFNGTSFDLPRVASRARVHELPDPFEGLVHVDLLRIARKLLPRQPMTLPDLERRMLGLSRTGDIPGSEAPLRWRTYERTGVNTGLLPLFKHNVQDIVSLAGLTAVFAQVLDPGLKANADIPEQSMTAQRVATPLTDLQERLQKTYRLRRTRERRGMQLTSEHAPTVAGHQNALGERLTGLRERAMSLIQSGSSEDALPLLHEMVALAPGNSFPIAQLVRYYEANGQPDIAQVFRARLKALGLGL